MRSIRLVAASLLASFSIGASAGAAELGSPTGPVVLTVTGVLETTDAAVGVAFDVEMLKALGEVSIETTTPWTNGVQTFTGVPLNRVTEALGVTEGTLKAVAINDYAVDIPVADAVEGGPIIAYLQNGEPMSVREKGPLWVIYPFDQNETYQSEVTYSRSIWQLVRIDVVSD